MVIDQTRFEFDQMQPHAATRLELSHIAKADRIPNALLFTGSRAAGKKETALWFAKQCNCLDTRHPGCGRCRSCLKIEANSHPDILHIAPEKQKKSITISQIRALGQTLSVRPNEARYRMALISRADTMNIQAQNALLKMLEEPPENTFFVLTTANAPLLLPTILSRCRAIRFKPVSAQQVQQMLSDTHRVDPVSASIAAETADADPQKALMYLNLDPDTAAVDWLKRRKWLLRSLFDLIASAASSMKDAPSKGLLLSWKLSLDAGLIDNTFAIIKFFFRDLMIFLHQPEKIVNLDFFDQFKDIGQILTKKDIFRWMDSVFEAEKKITSNCTLRLTLDSFFLQIAQIREE